MIELFLMASVLDFCHAKFAIAPAYTIAFNQNRLGLINADKSH